MKNMHEKLAKIYSDTNEELRSIRAKYGDDARYISGLNEGKQAIQEKINELKATDAELYSNFIGVLECAIALIDEHVQEVTVTTV